MRTAFLTITRHGFGRRTFLPLWFVALLSFAAQVQADEAKFESRTWTDRKGNQLTSTFVDAKNGEVQFKNDAGEIQKFKLADFAEPDQKYLRDLAIYLRKLAAGEKPALPADPAKASLDIQPLQTITDPVPDMAPYRKPLLEFPIRIWTDTTGKKVQGKFVTAYNDKIVIDVKGNVFDLAVTRLSPEDQQYVAVQLKGLQRDDLVNVLAKAAMAGQKPPAAGPAPAPTTVAGNAPASPTTLGTDDIRARLEQLKAQREGNPGAGTQVAANTPPAQPLGNDDIKARLARIRQQKGEPEPEFIPATSSGPTVNSPSIPSHRSSMEQTMQAQRERMERQQQEAQERMNRMAAESQARLNAQHQAVSRGFNSPTSSIPSQTYAKQCSKCRRVLPSHIGAGDRCPGCGIVFDFDETTGSYAVGYRIGQGLGVLIMIGIIIGVIKKLFG